MSRKTSKTEILEDIYKCIKKLNDKVLVAIYKYIDNTIVIITASIPPMISRTAGREAHGTALGAMETTRDIGQALGPIATGLVLTFFHIQLPLS